MDVERARADVETASVRQGQRIRSPELKRGNTLTRGVFATRPDGAALRFNTGSGRSEFVLPWGSSGSTVAGYVSEHGQRGYPVEYDAEELEELATLSKGGPEVVHLNTTPVEPLLDEDSEIGVSWHARVRWHQRVTEESYPAEPIREAFGRGVHVGVEDGRARFDPETGALLRFCEAAERKRIITVWPASLDEVNIGHLNVCPSCARLLDPERTDECECCGGATCPDCGGDLSSSLGATALLE